jgi:hypothetical protein
VTEKVKQSPWRPIGIRYVKDPTSQNIVLFTNIAVKISNPRNPFDNSETKNTVKLAHLGTYGPQF